MNMPHMEKAWLCSMQSPIRYTQQRKGWSPMLGWAPGFVLDTRWMPPGRFCSEPQRLRGKGPAGTQVHTYEWPHSPCSWNNTLHSQQRFHEFPGTACAWHPSSQDWEPGSPLPPACQHQAPPPSCLLLTDKGHRPQMPGVFRQFPWRSGGQESESFQVRQEPQFAFNLFDVLFIRKIFKSTEEMKEQNNEPRWPLPRIT